MSRGREKTEKGQEPMINNEEEGPQIKQMHEAEPEPIEPTDQALILVTGVIDRSIPIRLNKLH